MSNKLTTLAREILAIEDDLPHRLNYADRQRPTIDDFKLYTFEQTWADTSLGFGEIGGQAITTANTYVFIPNIDNQKCHVYFAGRYAYSVPYSRKIIDDVLAFNMASVHNSGKYMEEDSIGGN